MGSEEREGGRAAKGIQDPVPLCIPQSLVLFWKVQLPWTEEMSLELQGLGQPHSITSSKPLIPRPYCGLEGPSLILNAAGTVYLQPWTWLHGLMQEQSCLGQRVEAIVSLSLSLKL
jgi:hypothetical protein